MNIDLEIDFYRKKLEETKDKLMHSIIDAIVDEETFWKYYPMLYDVLPVGSYVGKCPACLDPWLRQCDHKEAVRYFNILLEGMEEYRDNTDSLVEYFSRDGYKIVEVLENNSTWDLMQQIIEFTLQNKVCGTTFDW